MIEYIKIEGFKSIKAMELDLKPVNILIGSNGSGKSNFINFFKLINALFNQRFQKYVAEEKADDILYFGIKTTEKLFGHLIFGNETNKAFYFEIAKTNKGGLYIALEASGYNVKKDKAIGDLSEKNLKENGYDYGKNLEESYILTSTSHRSIFFYDPILQIFRFSIFMILLPIPI